MTQVAVNLNDPNGSQVAPKNPDKLPMELAMEFSGPDTSFTTPEDALKGEYIPVSIA